MGASSGCAPALRRARAWASSSARGTRGAPVCAVPSGTALDLEATGCVARGGGVEGRLKAPPGTPAVGLNAAGGLNLLL